MLMNPSFYEAPRPPLSIYRKRGLETRRRGLVLLADVAAKPEPFRLAAAARKSMPSDAAVRF
jgi:hypothetical protein